MNTHDKIELPPLPEPLEIDWPELHSQALGCGVEDRSIHDRYEAAEYGWQDGVDKAADRVPDQIYDAEQMQDYARAAIGADRKRRFDTGEALRRYLDCGGEQEQDPIERLRFYCSIAMRQQDWLDAEPFFEALIADRQRRGEPVSVGLRNLLERCREFIDTTTCPAYPAGTDIAGDIDAFLALQPTEPVNQFRKCRHCGWDCKPSTEDREWHPLEQPVKPTRNEIIELLATLLHFIPDDEPGLRTDAEHMCAKLRDITSYPED